MWEDLLNRIQATNLDWATPKLRDKITEVVSKMPSFRESLGSVSTLAATCTMVNAILKPLGDKMQRNDHIAGQAKFCSTVFKIDVHTLDPKMVERLYPKEGKASDEMPSVATATSTKSGEQLASIAPSAEKKLSGVLKKMANK